MKEEGIRNYKELSEALAIKYAKQLREKFENGEMKNHCSACGSEQVLKLDGDKIKCGVCDNDIPFEVEFK